ncbi:MAG TPA: hypothetical protein VG265_12780 [Gaiellaceae bacterium]|nr:hypothetical protein [Gaiellaceae bacterium]
MKATLGSKLVRMAGTAFALACVLGLGAVPIGLADAGGSINCTSDLPAFGPLNVTETMGAGTSGSFTLGGDNNKFIGTCNLSGTIPAGWSVTELSGAVMSASPGAGNNGTFTWNTDDSELADTGTFTNAGTFVDVGTAFTQQIEVADFVNTGTVRSSCPGLQTAGAANVFDDKGVVEVDAKDTFELAGTFILDSGGSIRATGALDIAGSTFKIAGGAVTSGVLTSPYRLGVAPTAVSFAAGLPPSSKGTIDIGVPTTLIGVIPKTWALDVSATITATRGAGNAGTFVWEPTAGNSNLVGTTPFTNSGTFTDLGSGQVQQIQVPSFVNTGIVASSSEGMSMDGTRLFTNRGMVRVTAKGTFGCSGAFLLAPTGKIQTSGAFDIAGSTFEIAGGSVVKGTLVSPYHLGVGPTTIVFKGRLPKSSHGKIDVQVPTKVAGAAPKGWKLVPDGGQITH